MFDFPASPAIGDVSNGYMFNGVGWAGGPIVATPQEQFFDLSGKQTLDIDVPTWARGAKIEGSIFPGAAANYPAMQVSWDGTTFLAGTSYQVGGLYHNAAASPYYGTQGSAASPVMYLSYPRSSLIVPHVIDAVMNIAATNPQLISLTTRAQAYDGTGGPWTQAFQSYVNATVPNFPKKLRILDYNGGTFGANSWLRFTWLGADVPQTNGLVPEAPMDDNEYVRVNGVWRLKKQEFDTTGKTTLDITVPTSWTPKHCRLSWLISNATAAANAWLLLRGSIDGTTFLAGAADYYNAGMTGQGSPTGTVSFSVVTAYAYAWLDYGGENISVGHQGHALLNLRRNANSVMQLLSTSTVYSNTAGVAYRTHVITNYLTGGFGTSPLKAFRIFLGSGVAMGEGNIIAEWL